jgi:hypothetical protein
MLPPNESEEAAYRVLEQLQRTFCFMKYSKKRYFDPRPFVDACKTLNLNFNVYHQNDAAEFCDQLFDRIETCILLAPAGFQGAKSDSKFLFPKFFRKLLKTITSNSKLIVKIFKFGKQLGIINNGTYKFLELQTVIPERRNRLFDCWISLYNFPINLNKFKRLILHKNIRLIFYYGTTDYITPVKYARRFIKELPDSNIVMVEDGHYLGREKLAEVLKNDLIKSLP